MDSFDGGGLCGVKPFEFHSIELMHLPGGVVVVGRCGEAEFCVGDRFTELRWSQHERRVSSLRYETVAEDIVAEVQLRVEEISAYDRLWDRMYPGLTACLLLSGSGLEALAGIDFAADLRAGKSWSLWGQRHAAGTSERLASNR
jgi:hypothetical protein